MALVTSSDALVPNSVLVTTSMALVTSSFLFLITSLLLVVRILLVAMPGAPSNDALAPSSVLAPSSKARSAPSSVRSLLVAMPFVPSSDSLPPSSTHEHIHISGHIMTQNKHLNGNAHFDCNETQLLCRRIVSSPLGHSGVCAKIRQEAPTIPEPGMWQQKGSPTSFLRKNMEKNR